jgi:UDP-N-acetylglucosamine 1-carboxyvinyltransferase
MSKLLIEGGHKLKGKVNISGFKNAAVAILPASILAGDLCTIENLPNIEDVHVLKRILGELGAKVEFDEEKRVMCVNTGSIEE